MTMSRPFRFALLAAALALATAAAAKEGPLEGKSKAWEDAFNKGDGAAVAALYSEDGVILPPNEKRVQGRADIAKYARGMYDAGFRLRTTDTDAWVDGALGAKSGTYTVTDKDGKEVDHGKWLEVWHRSDDGQWLMVRDMWNSDDPPPPPPAPPPTPGVASDKE
jgi:uncharacterized protein (TIGR02246 family)